MMEQIFEMPTLNNRKESFKFLSKLQCEVLERKEKKIIFDFQKCQFSNAIFTSFLGAMTEIGQAHQKIITYRFTEDSELLEYFKKSGLYDYLVNDGRRKHTNQNALPFWKVKMNEDDLMTYIDNIIGLSRINIEDNARQQLFMNFYELFINARDHSNEKHGVYSCGHWMPKKKCLVFSLYDTGIGISKRVKNKFGKSMSDIEALEWALVGGNSTRQLEKGVPRGLGLSNIKKFVKLNNGRLTILSNGVFYDFNANSNANSNERIEKFPYENMGTMVCVTIEQDKEYIYVE